MRAAILCHTNLYETKLHFSLKLGEALERLGWEILYLDITEKPFEGEVLKGFLDFRPALTLSFNSFTADSNGRYFWEYMRIPHLAMLVDPPVYYREMTRSPYAYISCVDELDVAWLRQRDVEKSFFLPHAIERELHHPPEAERPYDVVLIGSCYDPDAAHKSARAALSPELFHIYEISVERTLQEADKPFAFVVDEELSQRGISLDDEERRQLCFYVDTFIRGKERLALVQAIRDVDIHIFGDRGWLIDYGVRDWPELLRDQSNVIFHPPLTYSDSLDILKKAKLSLNSMPFFKKGTHERIFASLAAGSIPISTQNLWLQDHFKDGEELLTFNWDNLSTLNERICDLLAHPQKRCHLAAQGQAKTLASHTWDSRAAILEEVFCG